MNDINPMALKKYLKTREDANYLVVLLERLSDGLFTNTINPDDVLEREIPYELSALLRKMMMENQLNQQDRAQLSSFVTTLKDAIVALPTIDLTVAIVPTQEVISLIHDWFLRNYQKLVVLNITTDQSLLAGTVIQFNGTHKDYSLKKQLSNQNFERTEVLKTENS